MKFLVDMRADLLELAAGGGGGGGGGAGTRGGAAGAGGGGQEGKGLGTAAAAGAGPTGGPQAGPRLEPAEAAALRAMAEHLRCAAKYCTCTRVRSMRGGEQDESRRGGQAGDKGTTFWAARDENELSVCARSAIYGDMLICHVSCDFVTPWRSPVASQAVACRLVQRGAAAPAAHLVDRVPRRAAGEAVGRGGRAEAVHHTRPHPTPVERNIHTQCLSYCPAPLTRRSA